MGPKPKSDWPMNFAMLIIILLLLAGVCRADTDIYGETPQPAVNRLLELAELTEDDVLYDFGSGNGNIVVTAAKVYGCRAVGLDNNPEMVALGKRNAERNHLGEDQVVFYKRDVLAVPLPKDATVVTCFLTPEMLRKLRPRFERLPDKTRIICYQHEVPGWSVEKVKVFQGRKIFRWRVRQVKVGTKKVCGRNGCSYIPIYDTKVESY